jgi:hypothetical protein
MKFIFLLFYLFYSFICCIFAAEIKKNEVMTSLQLNAELFRELSIISEDEGMMKKAIKALRRITTPHKPAIKKEAQDSVIDWDHLPELPKSFKRLRGMGHITQEDIDKDDRLAYIMGK